MKGTDPKVKLTVTVEESILDAAKRASTIKRIPLSRLIEGYLNWMADPQVYCFKCGERFTSSNATVCHQCGWLQCVKCKACRCALNDETAEALFHMRQTFEDLLGGRLK